MQNFWPCKSLPKRNGQLDTSGISGGGGHSVAYEDPDAHLHHHPLVMRHQHHNMEVIIWINFYFLLNLRFAFPFTNGIVFRNGYIPLNEIRFK